MTRQITPCLWYDNQAKEAGQLYCAAFPQAKIVSQSPIVTEVSLSGQNLILLDGGPMYKPNASISLYYVCEQEGEFDKAWKLLSEGGTVMMAAGKYPWSEKYGWISDRFGISWQLAVGKISDVGQRVTPCMLFTGNVYGQAEEAIRQYSSIFENVTVDGILRYGSNENPDVEGKVKHAQISLDGRKLMLMESASSHVFGFTEGVSLTLYCETQQEIDYYWAKLTEGGEESRCGWLKDKYGVSWQIIPTILGKIMSDPAKAGKAAQAFMSMRKLDIEQIVQASLS